MIMITKGVVRGGQGRHAWFVCASSARFNCTERTLLAHFLRLQSDCDSRQVPMRKKNLKPPLLLALEGLLIGKELAN